MEKTTILEPKQHDQSTEDLLGFHEVTPNNLTPVYKMQKPEVPSESERPKSKKTLLLKRDANSGMSYILINNQLVPIRKFPLNESRMCLPEGTKNNPKLTIESKSIRITEEPIAKVEKPTTKSSNNTQKRNKNSHTRCNLALSKHRNSLLDIIQNLRMDNKHLKSRLAWTKRKLCFAREQLETNACKYLDEIERLKASKSSPVKCMQTSIETPCDSEVELESSEHTVSAGNVKVEFLLGEVGGAQPSLDSSSDNNFGQFTSYLMGKDVNMGVNLQVPNVRNLGYGGTSPQQLNDTSKFILWMCYKMCDQQDEEGDFPIHIAVMKDDLAAVKRQCQALKARNINVDIENGHGQTPLQLAVVNKVSPLIIKELNNHNANFSETDGSGNNIYHLAASNSYLKELHKNNLISSTEDMNVFNYQGYTPLMLAVLNKNCDDVQVLVLLGANLNLQDKTSGKTALFHAVESNSLDLVSLLMTAGADTSKKNYSGLTVQETINELDVSMTLKRLFTQLEEVDLAKRSSKRTVVKEKVNLRMISKKVKI